MDNLVVLIKTFNNYMLLVKAIRKADEAHFIGNPGFTMLLVSLLSKVFLSKRNLYISLGDGQLFDKISARGLIQRLAVLLARSASCNTTVYSRKQKRDLIGISDYFESAVVEFPFIKVPKSPVHLERGCKYRILYMSHLSYFKGFDLVLSAFKMLRDSCDKFELVVCNSGIMGDVQLLSDLASLEDLYPGSIIIKGKVDPFVELASADIYLYPFKSLKGTFAFPFTFYESLAMGTPFLAMAHDGLSEIFGDQFFIDQTDNHLFISKLVDRITELRGVSDSEIVGLVGDGLQNIKDYYASQ